MPKEDKNLQTKKIEAELGNLQVQNADYQQIVQELSDKLSKYETLHGTVFVKGDRDSKV